VPQPRVVALVFKVPWVVREPSNQALKDSRFCKEVLSSDDKKQTENNLQLYSLINEAFFPIYLPSRYHSMDCVAIKKETESEGNYWGHASHFLLSNHLHGAGLWQVTSFYGNDPSIAKFLKSLPFITTKKKRFVCKFHYVNQKG